MDSDNDGLSDYEAEVASSGADATLLDGSADTDGDGISNKDELAAGTDPANVDSDNDGISDAVELANNMDPTDGSDASIDSDGDGMNDGEEISRAPTQHPPTVLGTALATWKKLPWAWIHPMAVPMAMANPMVRKYRPAPMPRMLPATLWIAITMAGDDYETSITDSGARSAYSMATPTPTMMAF